MDRSIIQTREARFLLTAAAIVVIVAGLRAASPILVRFLLSLFIAVISAPVLFWLKRKGCPTGLALVLVILVILSSGMLLVAVVGTSLNDFSSALPAYQTRLLQQAGALFTWLEGKGIEVPHRVLLQYFDPGAAMRLAASILTSLSGVLTNAFFILLTVVFILLEASSFPEKLRSILEDPENSFIHLNKFVETVKRYIAIKTLVSLLTGVFITVWLQILGVDFALLWGLLAFMPAVLLTLVQLGVGPALLAGLGYLVVNLVMGNVLEPGLMGRRLGLSTLIVFLSLVFWGWVLGPIGMLLSVPLTMTLKIALESREETRKISFLLGSETTFPTPSPIQAETSPSASPDSGGPESSESAV
jgi:predicted PurR-regulated permease PerM